jgi:hypothetical protein
MKARHWPQRPGHLHVLHDLQTQARGRALKFKFWRTVSLVNKKSNEKSAN